ncbi:thiamine diphosphate-binding protein [Dunaliella salina]|uniref:Thiamine diphosphate-binding protein n=1 Tax=Dunaliella salina TaxID=3046 RepID=A0ABQ7GFI3_DUNSA|nr:thiamine diphosphate-binding protein [Dunaliella salina]|eukprot:KAF5833363.1 thiamine diphosphate-binding protein [Dunaliella salina]
MHYVSALDKLAEQGNGQGIRAILGLHETVCSGAADGYARMAGKPAAVLLHLGPGLANGLTNLHNARRAGTPVVVIVGQMSTSHREDNPTWDPLLSMDIQAIASPVSALILSPKLIRQPPASTDGCIPSIKHAPPPTISSPSPTAGLSTQSASSYDLGHDIGAGMPSHWVFTSSLRDWLGGTQEVWDVLRGSAPASNVVHRSREEGGMEGGGQGSSGFVVVKDRSSVPNPGQQVDAHEPKVEVLVDQGNAGSCSRVVTLIVPHDLSWQVLQPDTLDAIPPNLSATSSQLPFPAGQRARMTTAAAPSAAADPDALATPGLGTAALTPSGPGADIFGGTPGAAEYVRACAAAMKAAPKGKVALFVGGEALLEKGGALRAAGLVAAATGAALVCGTNFARMDRGAGLPCPTRLPYFPQEALVELSKYEVLVIVDVPLPVAQFGYKDVPTQLVQLDEEAVWEFDTQAWGSGSAAVALGLLASELGAAQRVQPGVNCGGLFPPLSRPAMPLPGMRLSPPLMCTVIASMQPEGCVVVDESLTSGGAYWNASRGAPRFSHLTLTGGAIGSGPPMALGAAVACPKEQIINIQADGSAMYGLQALWTQARERTKVITVICANSTYAILKVECMRQRLPPAGPATRALTDLGQPALDWCALAQGMGVPSSKASTVQELASAMERGLKEAGPFLIEASLS